MKIKLLLPLGITAALLNGCASFKPAPTDKIQTAEQAIQIAKAACDVRGLKGEWSGTWASGAWTVDFLDKDRIAMLQVSIASSDGKMGQCGWIEV